MPGMSLGMKELIQKTTSSSSPSLSSEEGEPPTQHCTSLGPGQRFVTKVPLLQPVLVSRQVPLEPAVSVQGLPRQHLTSAGSLGQ